MPFYIEQGWYNKKIQQENPNISPLEWLAEYIPKQIKRGAHVDESSIESFANSKPYLVNKRDLARYYMQMEGVKDKQDYFIYGYIEPTETGKVQRNHESIVRRGIITLDYDDYQTPLLDEFVTTVKSVIPNVAFLVYPTIKYTDEYPRWRLVIELDRPLLEYEYKVVAKDLAEKIGLVYDVSVVSDWAKTSGLPVKTPRNKHIEPLLIEGDRLKVPKLGEIKPPIKPSSQVTGAYSSTRGTIEHEEAIAIMKRYLEINGANLQDYDASIFCIVIIAKAVSTGEIDYNTGLECITLLAMDNNEWIDGNIEKFNHLVSRDNYRTNRTFWYQFKKTVDYQLKPSQTLIELKEKLKQKGNELREKGNKKQLTYRETATILYDLTYGARLGKYSEDSAILAIYNPDKGIYEISEHFIKQLIRIVEPQTNKRGCNEVMDFLETDLPMKQKNTESHLIAFKNGIFNLKTKKLEPFTHEIILDNTNAINYNLNATEPIFDGWRFTDWLNDIAGEDKEKVILLWQLIGGTIQTNVPSGHVPFLYSAEGQTGKSTFQDLLINLVGEDNIVSIRLGEMEKRFALSTALGKSLIIGDDNQPNDYNPTSQNLKSLVTGDLISTEAKGKQMQTYKFTAQVVQSMNGLPIFGDISEGVTRRLRIIEFKTKFTGEKLNPRVKTHYIKDTQLLEWVAKEALQYIVEDGQSWIETNEHRYYVEEIKLDSDPVARYVAERLPQFTSTRLPIKFLFLDFQAFYYEENGTSSTMQQRTFTRRIQEHAKKDGWTYHRNNFKPLESFHREDLQAYNDIKAPYAKGYAYETEIYKTQALIYK